jgi:probable F420-dependent oxidoreductase
MNVFRCFDQIPCFDKLNSLLRENFSLFGCVGNFTRKPLNSLADRGSKSRRTAAFRVIPCSFKFKLARALEERGFESLFVCEHTHIPVSRRTPFSGGGELPKRYSHTHDPFVALSFAAAATRTLKIGTGIALIPQRDPIVTAKSVASLDQLSGGRFIFAIGGGWNVDEMENHGARYETRFKLLRERVLAMKALWTQEQAEFHGQFVNFDPVWLYPKPKQRPHPPILLGGETDHTVRRVVEFCDGWFPRGRGGWEPKSATARLRQAALAAGRNPATLSITVFNAPADPAALVHYREAEIARVLLEVPDLGRDEVLRLLDKYAPLHSVPK